MPCAACNRGVLLVAVVLICLALCSSWLAGCGPGSATSRERPGGGSPGGGQAPGAGGGGGVPAREWTPGEAGAVEVPVEANVATAGRFRQLLGLTWVGERELLALARDEGGESIVRFSCRAGGVWERRVVLTFKESATPEHFTCGHPWRGTSRLCLLRCRRVRWRLCGGTTRKPPLRMGVGCYRVAERVNAVFRMSLNGARAVLYDNDGASVMDFRTGQRFRLHGVPAHEFPLVGIGSSWSPDGIHYLYQVVEGQVARWFGIVGTDAGAVVRRVARDKRCAFGGACSPDGSRVASLALDG